MLASTSKCLVRGLSSGGSGPRVAVIGTGPAGFYFAGSLLRSHPTANVILLEAEPLPFGLVRFGNRYFCFYSFHLL